MTGADRTTTEIVVSVPTLVKAVGIFFALVLAYLVRDRGNSSDDIPGYVDKAQHSGVLQDVDRQTDAFKKLESVAADAAKNLPSAAVNLLGATAGIVGSVFSLVTLTSSRCSG